MDYSIIGSRPGKSITFFFLTFHRAYCFNFAFYLPTNAQISKIQCKTSIG